MILGSGPANNPAKVTDKVGSKHTDVNCKTVQSTVQKTVYNYCTYLRIYPMLRSY